MFRFNFYKEQYYKEIERRNGLYNSLNIPLTIITALFGLISYMLFNYNFNSPILLNILFLSSISVNVYISIRIVENFFSTFKYKTLKIFPHGDFLDIEKKNVEVQVNEFNTGKKRSEKVNIDNEHENSLCIIILDMLKVLVEDNNIKAEKVSKLQSNLYISFIIAMISIVFFTYNNFAFPKENIQKIIIMSKDKTPQKPVFQVKPISKPVETQLEISPVRNQAKSNNNSSNK